MNMNNNEFNSFLFSQIRKAMDHLKIQKPRLYAIRYCKIMKYFTSVVSTQRERERLAWFCSRRERGRELRRKAVWFEGKWVRKLMEWMKWRRKWKGSVWMSFVFIDFKVPRGGINDLFYFFFFFSFLESSAFT